MVLSLLLISNGFTELKDEIELKNKIENLGYSPISKSLIGDDLNYVQVLNKQLEFINTTEEKILNELLNIEKKCIKKHSKKLTQKKINKCVLQEWKVNSNREKINYISQEIKSDYKIISKKFPKKKKWYKNLSKQSKNLDNSDITTTLDSTISPENYLIYGVNVEAYKDQNSEVKELLDKYSNLEDGKREIDYSEIAKTTVAIATGYVVGKYVGEKILSSKTEKKSQPKYRQICSVNNICPFNVCSVVCTQVEVKN